MCGNMYTYMLTCRYALDLTEQEVSQTMESFIPSITSWCQDYLSGGKMTGKMEVRKFWNKTDSKSWTNVGVSVPEVRDIEETVWSPRYSTCSLYAWLVYMLILVHVHVCRFGLKGKIDVTVAVQVNVCIIYTYGIVYNGTSQHFGTTEFVHYKEIE